MTVIAVVPRHSIRRLAFKKLRNAKLWRMRSSWRKTLSRTISETTPIRLGIQNDFAHKSRKSGITDQRMTNEMLQTKHDRDGLMPIRRPNPSADNMVLRLMLQACAAKDAESALCPRERADDAAIQMQGGRRWRSPTAYLRLRWHRGPQGWHVLGVLQLLEGEEGLQRHHARATQSRQRGTSGTGTNSNPGFRRQPNMKVWLPRYWPDYKALESVGEILTGHTNKGARWLNDHPNDPYWRAHRMCNHQNDWSEFPRFWRTARLLSLLREP